MEPKYISVPVKVDTFVAFVHFLDSHYPDRDQIEVLDEAIAEWIQNWSWDGDLDYMQRLRKSAR